MKRPIRVCFVSPYNYPLFNPSVTTKFGGFEVQIYQITRELAFDTGFQVSIIVADHGQPHLEKLDGIEILSWKGRKFHGIPGPEEVEDEAIIIDQLEMSSGERHEVSVNSGLDSTELPGGQINLTQSKRALHWQNIKQNIRTAYKKIVPWKIRIVIHNFLHGSKYALINFSKSVRQSVIIFIETLRPTIRVARLAFADINDQPVYFEEIAIFEEADADIYIVPGNSQYSALAACYSKKRCRAFVMLAGSDMDFLPEIKDNPAGCDIYMVPNNLKRYAIQNAVAVIVQSEKQECMVRYFGISPVLIRNPFDMERQFPKADNPQYILWVGNTGEQVKRPALFIEIARRLPEYRFTMVLTANEPEIYERYNLDVALIPNLSLVSRLPFQEIERIFAQARLFINTSSFEGFPNTFLQAGKYGVPVIALNVDPNGMLTQQGCGFYCEDDLEILILRVRQLMEDHEFYEQTSARILSYVQKFHDRKVVIPQYKKTFTHVVRNFSIR